MKKSLNLSAAAVAAALALAGCAASEQGGAGGSHGSTAHHGAGNPSAPSASEEFNSADIMFARMMIPHHEQAVEMGDLMLAKEGVPAAVTELAARIKAAQAPEIDRMSAWLSSWGQPRETPDHAGHSMSGMMSAQDLERLEAAPGAEAAELFLAQMIAHHEGALEMARTEEANGRNPEAVQLSKEIIDSQEAEIKQMQEVLERDPSAAAAALPSAHVHGLIIDGETGQVLLATHDGLYDASRSPATKIGAANDLMGFTVGASGVFYASGHPGPGSQLPNPLGLIRSADGGRTWEQLSRQGHSDFHALTAVRSGIVGFDGQLLISPDGENWTAVEIDFVPAVLAGNPAGDVVLATTQQGLQRSTDGGKTWSLNRSAPTVQFAAFGSDTAVVGVEPDGTVHMSFDAGGTWSRTGQVDGQVQAVAATGGPDGKVQLWVATTAGILVSGDGGATFTQPAMRG